MLDFGYATGLRASELVGATLGHIETDPRGDYWLRVTGKGNKLARAAATARDGSIMPAMPTGRPSKKAVGFSLK
nr:hypothetical protein [Paraburkholderia tropica]